MSNPNPRSMGSITVNDDRGYAYLPKQVRVELNHKGRGKIPYFLNANTVLLIRKGASKEQVLEGLDLLKKDLALRWSDAEVGK